MARPPQRQPVKRQRRIRARRQDLHLPCESTRPSPTGRSCATVFEMSTRAAPSLALSGGTAPRNGGLQLSPSHLARRRMSGEVAVIQDEGESYRARQHIEHQETGLRYLPKVGGGYDIVRTDSSFRKPLGDRVPLDDDATVAQNLAFDFSFFDTTHSVAFVNSDGNITFGEGDDASSPREDWSTSLGRSARCPVSGRPRPFSRWHGLRSFRYRRVHDDLVRGSRSGTRAARATLQVSLFVDGTIEMRVCGRNVMDGDRRRRRDLAGAH